MVEEETCRCFTFAIKCGYGLGPLSELINYNNDVFMIVVRGRVDCHEVNYLFAEGTN